MFTVNQIKPMAGYILLEQKEVETKTASGIYIPEDQAKQERPSIGTVIEVSESTYVDGVLIECKVSVGDKIYFKKWGGSEIKVDGKEYQFLQFSDILGVIDEEKT